LIRSGTLTTDETWTTADSPVVIPSNVTISEGIEIKIKAGTELRLGERASITVQGRLDAVGHMDHPIVIQSEGNGRWGTLSFEQTAAGSLSHCIVNRGSTGSGNRIGMVSVYRCAGAVTISDCTFTNWPDDFNSKAVEIYHSPNVRVSRCYFGEGRNEAVHGVNSPAVVEYNIFARRFGYSDAVDIGNTTNPGPIIRRNVFLGSDDDAIDLDECDAYVEGNLVMNCRGGNNDPNGISGDQNARPIIVNNIVLNCESGIGFKNGAQITVINNTIINCDRGIWLHQNPTHARVINTIIWGEETQVPVKLEPGSTIDISYSIVQGNDVYPGTGNLNSHPRFIDEENGMYGLSSESPAIDAGWGGEGILPYDFHGNERSDISFIPNTGAGIPHFIDIGAIEFIPPATWVKDWRRLH
jgi:hypothetical protein